MPARAIARVSGNSIVSKEECDAAIATMESSSMEFLIISLELISLSSCSSSRLSTASTADLRNTPFKWWQISGYSLNELQEPQSEEQSSQRHILGDALIELYFVLISCRL